MNPGLGATHPGEGEPSGAPRPPRRLGASPYRLFRVDDRLLHGQVALAWGRHLQPRHFLLADDRLAADSEAGALYALSAPEGTTVEVMAVEELLRADPASMADPAQTVLLVRGVAEACRLLHAGVPGPVNLGGLHPRIGAHAVFPFLYLTPEDELLLVALLREGHELFAQDLPDSPRRNAREWLAVQDRFADAPGPDVCP